MNDLGSALRELAGTAQAPHPADPHALWSQGRARVRRRRAGAAAVLVVAVVLGYLGMVRPTPTVVMPAGEPHAPAIPMNIYAPNRFLAGVSDEGAPGQLAAIAQTTDTDEGDLDDTSFWFGISATTGVYIRLDLPDMATDSPLSLSPDGRKVAYVVTGPTRKQAYDASVNDPEPEPFPKAPGAGIGVYDTDSGSVNRHMILEDYGIWTNEVTLSWLSGSRLAFGFYRLIQSNGGFPAGAFRWDYADSAPVSMGTLEPDAANIVAGRSKSELVRVGGDIDVVDLDGVPTGRKVRGGNGIGPFDVSISGDRVLSTTALGRNGGIRQVLTGVQTDLDRAPELRAVGNLVLPDFLGWLSDTSVLVVAEESEVVDGTRIRALDGGPRRHLYSVNLSNGATMRLGSFDLDVDQTDFQVARALLDQPMVDGRKPPSLVRSLRTEIVIGGVLMVAAGIALYFRPKRRAWRAYLARERERHGAA